MTNKALHHSELKWRGSQIANGITSSQKTYLV